MHELAPTMCHLVIGNPGHHLLRSCTVSPKRYLIYVSKFSTKLPPVAKKFLQYPISANVQPPKTPILLINFSFVVSILKKHALLLKAKVNAQGNLNLSFRLQPSSDISHLDNFFRLRANYHYAQTFTSPERIINLSSPSPIH